MSLIRPANDSGEFQHLAPDMQLDDGACLFLSIKVPADLKCGKVSAPQGHESSHSPASNCLRFSMYSFTSITEI